MNDPQNDIPCTACEVEGPRSRLDDDGLCPDCRTPAGRLVTALGVLGIKATMHADYLCATVDGLTVDADWAGWSIVSGWDDDSEEAKAAELTKDDFVANIEAAADAIAAIVQAPGLRKDRAALHEALEKVRGAVSVVAHAGEEYVDAVVRLRAERDTLAARVAVLEAHNGRMAEAWLQVARACDAARDAFGSKWGENGGAENVACFLPGETWAKTGNAIRDLAGGAS
jgi:hypothetical protein